QRRPGGEVDVGGVRDHPVAAQGVVPELERGAAAQVEVAVAVRPRRGEHDLAPPGAAAQGVRHDQVPGPGELPAEVGAAGGLTGPALEHGRAVDRDVTGEAHDDAADVAHGPDAD